MRLYLVVLFGMSLSVSSFSLTPYAGFHAVDKQLPFPSLKECPHLGDDFIVQILPFSWLSCKPLWLSKQSTLSFSGSQSSRV